MSKEECIEFPNKEGLVLRGVLHYGSIERRKDITLITLNTGLNDMTGWHRLQVKNARYLASKGYNVLRFNDTGIGNSDGEILEQSIVKIFSDIETGLFVDNADSAVDFVKGRFPDDRLVYLGYCGGGLTAIHSAAKNKKIAGVIDIAGPITLSSDEYMEKADPWEVKKNIVKYKTKILKLDPWIRFLTGKGEYKTIYNSLIHYIKHTLRDEYKDNVTMEDISSIKGLNIKFFESFDTYTKSNRPLLFYFAELDSATWEFRKYFLAKYQDRKFRAGSIVTYIEVPRANHIFSSDEAQERLKTDISMWLENNYIK
jgi:pimeloyl-ACP methyl ester carboxylesterase